MLMSVLVSSMKEIRPKEGHKTKQKDVSGNVGR
jgi:hypothetical protein